MVVSGLTLKPLITFGGKSTEGLKNFSLVSKIKATFGFSDINTVENFLCNLLSSWVDTAREVRDD